MTAAQVMDITSRLSGCAGQAADAVSAFSQVKMEDAHKLLKVPKSECPDFWIRLPQCKWPKSWSTVEDPVVPLERNLYGHPLAGLLWERQFEKILLKHGWKMFPIGNDCSHTVKQGYSYLCMWMTSNWLERNKTLILYGKVLNKKLIWENQQHLSWFMYTWDALKVNVKETTILLTITEPCLNHEYPLRELKNNHAQKTFVFLRGSTTWKVMQRSVWNDIVSWQTRRLNNSTKYLLHALMTIISKKIVEICRRIVKSIISNCSEMFVLGTY